MDMPHSPQDLSQDVAFQTQMYQCCIFCNQLVPFHPDKNHLWRYVAFAFNVFVALQDNVQEKG